MRWSSYVGDVRPVDNLSKSYGVGGRRRPSSRGPFSTTAAASAGIVDRLLVIGSGVAGCAAALSAARLGVRCTVLHAGSEATDCNSYWAQGGIIYRNYDLGGKGGADTPLSLVEDVRRASGYRSGLARDSDLEERDYSPDLHLNGGRAAAGRRCRASGVTWNEDAAWKLALEGPHRVRQLLLGPDDGGRNGGRRGDDDDDECGWGCVVPFDRVAVVGGAGGGGEGEGEGRRRSTTTLSLCLEASHSAPRIAHLADRTGAAITRGITSAAMRHPLIDFAGNAVAVDLLFDECGDDDDDGGGGGGATVIGARVLDGRTGRIADAYATRGVVLASGGLAGIYEHTTNPGGFNALGSSAALALRLEDRLLLGGGNGGGGVGGGGGGDGIVSDLEYVQFHPTALCVPGESRFLLTEALRGEGAVLRDASGRAFARDYHPDGELAPRDVVARAVYEECRRGRERGDGGGGGGAGHNAYLDATHRDPAWLVGRFPGVHAHLSSESRIMPLDFTREMIPVTPAAHYTCGGVTTDLDGRVFSRSAAAAAGEGGGRSRRNYRNLYAAGESARTGLHGGNRLASTSLLEGLVFGSSVGEAVAASASGADRARRAVERRLATTIPATSGPSSSPSSHRGDGAVAAEASAILARLKSVMWEDVGVIRSRTGLERAVSELSAMLYEADRLWVEAACSDSGSGGGGREAAALRDAARAGLAVADAALANRVSGGCHYVSSEGEEEEDGARSGGGPTKEQDSDDDDNDGPIAARA